MTFQLQQLQLRFPLQVVERQQRFHIHGFTTSGQTGLPVLLTQMYDDRGQGFYELSFTPQFLLQVADLIYRNLGTPPPTHVTVGMTYTPPPAAPKRRKKRAPPPAAEGEVEAIRRRMLEGR